MYVCIIIIIIETEISIYILYVCVYVRMYIMVCMSYTGKVSRSKIFVNP